MCKFFLLVRVKEARMCVRCGIYEELDDEFKIQSNTTNTTTNNIRIYIPYTSYNNHTQKNLTPVCHISLVA